MIEFSLKEGDRLQITGLRALLEIIVQLAFVWLAFFAIQGIPPKLPILIVLMDTGLGYLCAKFFLNILSAIGNLTYLIG